MDKTTQNMNIPASIERINLTAKTPGRPVLIGAGAFTMMPYHPEAPHCVDTWLFEFFLTGRLSINVGDQGWRIFESGTAALYPPRTTFREHMPAGCPECTSFTLFFDDNGYTPLQEKFGQSQQAWHVEDPDSLLRNLIQSIESAMDPAPASDLLIEGCFIHLIAALVRGEQVDDSVLVRQGGIVESNLITRTHHFMRRHLSEPIRLIDIAFEVGLTESGFSHAYRRATGTSPMAVLRTMRIETATAFLLRSQMTLQSIAEQTGFADAFHLSRTFKQITGVSPSHYRRSIKD